MCSRELIISKSWLSRGGSHPLGGTGRQKWSPVRWECFDGRFDSMVPAWADEYNAQELEGLHITTVIPQDGAITTGYALIINKWHCTPMRLLRQWSICSVKRDR